MKLRVATPTRLIVDVDDTRHVRAEDSTGAFGILPGHADFVTVLPVSVVTWRNGNDDEHFVVVGGGVLLVEDGARVEIVTRRAVTDDEIDRLGDRALADFREAAEVEQASRASVSRLHAVTMRQIQRVLDASRHVSPDFGGAGEETGQ